MYGRYVFSAQGACRFRLLASLTLSWLIVIGVDVSAMRGWAEEPGKPKIVDGQTQVVAAFKNPKKWIRHDLWVETEFDSDGDGKLDRMHVDVTRPEQTDTQGLQVPVIYVTSPYFGGTGSTDKDYFWDPHQELGAEPRERKEPPPIKPKSNRPVISESHVKEWVPHGYAVVHSSSPGTGLSQGCPTVGGENESLAPKAVVDWLNGRAAGFSSPDGDERVEASWATGKVGMTGTSYNGTLPLAAATTGVDGLEAIIPIAPNTSYYHYYRSNGLVRHPGGFRGEDIDVLYDFIHSGNDDRRDYCDCHVRDQEMATGFDRATGDYNEFWAGRDYLHALDSLEAATLMSHAFNDWNVMPEHSVRIYQALKEKGVPSMAFFHQGGHGGAPPMKLMNRWFTRYLHNVENGVEHDPRAWIVREDAKRTEPTAYEDYPHPEAADVTLHLLAGAPRVGALSVEPQLPQPQETLVDNYSFDGAALARAEWTTHRLLYLSEPLTEPIHISGTPRVTIRLASNKEAVNLSIWVVSLPWSEKRNTKITDNIITRGWADPQNHRSIVEGEPLTPGEFYQLEFSLQPDDQIIPVGQQIGLMILASDRDFTLWPEPGTELTVDLNATTLSLPVVGGLEAFRQGVSQKPRDESELTKPDESGS